MSRSVDGEIIASTSSRPADEHIRVCKPGSRKPWLVEAAGAVLCSTPIPAWPGPPTRSASSGALCPAAWTPAALFSRAFSARQEISRRGSPHHYRHRPCGYRQPGWTRLFTRSSRARQHGVHLSRKLAEQRVFPAIDINVRAPGGRSLMDEDELSRVWLLRRRLANVDESGALNLVIDKLKQSATNRDFLQTIKTS